MTMHIAWRATAGRYAQLQPGGLQVRLLNNHK